MLSSKNAQATPTPREFVQYLISEVETNGAAGLDSHFKPQWITGCFCDANYDYIGTMETFSRDVENIRKILHIPTVIKTRQTLCIA